MFLITTPINYRVSSTYCAEGTEAEIGKDIYFDERFKNDRLSMGNTRNYVY
jgi:hypothetical protein